MTTTMVDSSALFISAFQVLEGHLPNEVRDRVGKLKFYNISSPLIPHVCTVCVMFDSNFNLLARGLSICSLNDQYSKKIGKSKSFGRAIKALINKQTSDPINYESMTGYSKTRRFNTTKTDINIFYSDAENLSKQIQEIYRELYGNVNLWLNIKTTYKEELGIVYFKIPNIYPLLITASKFSNFKSQYMPEVVEDDKPVLQTIPRD